MNLLAYSQVTCGGMTFSSQIPIIIGTIVNVIKIVTPIILVIYGMLDLMKAVMAQKEDEIKKGQQTLIKRVVAAILVFFVVAIVQLVFNVISNGEDQSVWSCFDCFVNGPSERAKVSGGACRG